MRKLLLAAGALAALSAGAISNAAIARDGGLSPAERAVLDRKLARLGVEHYDEVKVKRRGTLIKVDDAVIGGVKYDIYVNRDMTLYTKRKDLLQR